MSYHGVYYSKSKDKWASQTRVNGKTIQLGTFDTPEEASMAYVAFKTTIKREPTPSDYKRLQRYIDYCEFCKTPRTISEMFANFHKSNTGSVRSASDYLVNNKFMRKTIRDLKTNAKDKYIYVTIKDFTETDLKPMGRSSLQQLKFDATMKAREEVKILGAKVYNFDSGELRQKYTEQRKLDRLSAKIPKTYVSGSSLTLL
jgi:hypothetical protein